MSAENQETESSRGKRMLGTSRKLYKSVEKTAVKAISKGTEISAAGIDKSTGASKYQTDAIAINGRLERALHVIEESLTLKTEENARLAQQVADLRVEATHLRRQLDELQARVQLVPVHTAGQSEGPISSPKRRWWRRTSGQ